MKTLIVVAAFTLGAMMGPRSVAAEEGCSPVGSFMTTDPSNDFSSWITTVTGQGNAGTIETEVVQWPPKEQSLPPGTRLSTLRGVWKRTGGSTYAFTQVGLVFDSTTGMPLFARSWRIGAARRYPGYAP